MPDPLADLPTLARNVLAAYFGLPQAPAAVNPEILQKQGACFVTLTRNGTLRGCIGSLEAHRPIGDDLRGNALAAALRDPRFPPLTAAELPQIEIEVSILGEAQPLAFASEAEALAQLRPGIDGVILSAGGRRATFLPQVWEQLPEPADQRALEELVGELASQPLDAGRPLWRCVVVDAYAGAGTIALCMARHAQKVVAIEVVPQAVESARRNARPRRNLPAFEELNALGFKGKPNKLHGGSLPFALVQFV